MFVGIKCECGCSVSAERCSSWKEDLITDVTVCRVHATYHQDKLKALADAVYARQRVIEEHQK